MRNNKIAIAIAIVVPLFTVALIFLITSQNNDPTTSDESETNTQQQDDSDSVMGDGESTMPDEYFECKVDGVTVDYSSNMNLDEPIPGEPRLSGIADNGTNVKVTIKATAAGEYTGFEFVGMNYQPRMDAGYDYSKVYTTKSNIEETKFPTLNLEEISTEKISGEFSGFVYDGNDNELQLQDCKFSILR